MTANWRIPSFLRSDYAPLAAMALIAAYLLLKLTLIVNGVVS